MLDLSQKLMASAQRRNIVNYSAAFNRSVRSQRHLQKSLFRIGLWPIISDTESEIGMGLGLVLAALLERWSSVGVYRLLAQVSDLPSSYKWSIDDSQFGVDDWEVEGLDENVAIWGRFEVLNSRFHFSISVENDAREDEIVFELAHETDSLIEIINLLPSLATKIITWLNPDMSDRPADLYSNVSNSDTLLIEQFLRDIFHWELEYYLTLWGQTSNLANIESNLSELVILSKQMKGDCGAWMIAQSMSRIMIFDDINWSSLLIAGVQETVESLIEFPVIATVLCVTIFRLNYSLEAFDLLENSLVVHPEHSAIWNTLGALYSELREDLAALDVYQRAIEANFASANIYMQYANLMKRLGDQQIELKLGNRHISSAGRPFLERYVFADPNKTFVNLHEVAVAYDHAFGLDDSLDALSQLVSCLFSLKDTAVWKHCRTLVERDIEGTIVESIIEQLSDGDIVLMIEVLQETLENMPQQVNTRINLIRAHLAISQYTEAKFELSLIPRTGIPTQNQLILSRLQLSTDIHDFETRLGEINDIIHAKGKASSDDIEFLETVIKKEPSFTEGYRLLAECYLSWNELDNALEVLLDCQNNAPFDPEVSALLAKVLWEAGQPDLAFAYLEKGLNQNPENATLLSLNGRFLFENGHDEDAKGFLLRAEEIDPTNSELTITRLYIANKLITTRKG